LNPVLVECYETTSVELGEEAFEQLRRADVVFIGAPSAWRVARAIVTDGAWVLVPGVTTLAAVRADHERVLLGWGEDFTPAWVVITDPTP
jgi:precorrin-2 methylase